VYVGGVRTSTLRDAVVDSKGKSGLLTPLSPWGPGTYLRDITTFGGYTAFAQAPKRPAPKPFVAPAGLVLAKSGRCTAGPKLAICMKVKNTKAISTGAQ
jgi:hypothetical protein